MIRLGRSLKGFLLGHAAVFAFLSGVAVRAYPEALAEPALPAGLRHLNDAPEPECANAGRTTCVNLYYLPFGNTGWLT